MFTHVGERALYVLLEAFGLRGRLSGYSAWRPGIHCYNPDATAHAATTHTS